MAKAKTKKATARSTRAKVPAKSKTKLRAKVDPRHTPGKTLTPKAEFDGARFRRRLQNWQPTRNSTNAILAMQGELLRARSRDLCRNNSIAVPARDSFVANLVGDGIKPSSLITDPVLRAQVMEEWLDWTTYADADGVTDFYGLQEQGAAAVFEAGEFFIRYRPRFPEDGFIVPLQIQLLESEMLPYTDNRIAPNGNYIMNGVEFDWRGKRVAYHFLNSHPGDAVLDREAGDGEQTRVPASEVLHIFRATRPGQVRGVPFTAPAMVRMHMLDRYDDAELERKRTAAMFAGFVTSPEPESLIDDNGYADGEDGVINENAGLAGLEPGTLQTLLPGEDIKFAEPAEVGGSYELFQFRQQLAAFSSMGTPYMLATGDTRRANFSSLRGVIVEYRRKISQLQNNAMIAQMLRPVWGRWMETAVLAGLFDMPGFADAIERRQYTRARFIPPEFLSADPVKDVTANKLAVDAGFKSRSDVIEESGSDPEENDARIKADKDRENDLGLTFLVSKAAATQPADDEVAQEAAQQAIDENADDDAQAAASTSRGRSTPTPTPRRTAA